jgi:hypothetical protein
VSFSPENVQETGVSPGGRSGSDIVAAEAEQVERTTKKDLVTLRSEVFVPYNVVRDFERTRETDSRTE